MGVRTRASGFALALTVTGCELVGPIPDLTSGPGSIASDAAIADASLGAESGAAAPCSGPSLYCNSFELPGDLTSFPGDNVTAAIDMTVSRVGRGSVRLRLQDESRNGVINYQGPVAVPAHVFVRVLVHFDREAADTLSIHTSDYADAVHAYVGAEGVWHVAKYAETDLPTGARPSLNEWNCVELELDTDNKVVNAWFDDAGPFAVKLQALKAPFDSISLVMGTPQMKTAWYDDFMFATERIGCP